MSISSQLWLPDGFDKISGFLKQDVKGLLFKNMALWTKNACVTVRLRIDFLTKVNFLSV